MEAQRIAIDAVVALTDCDRDAVAAFVRRLYLAGVKDPKRLTFKGLQSDGEGLTAFWQRYRMRCGARSRRLLSETPFRIWNRGTCNGWRALPRYGQDFELIRSNPNGF